MSRPLKTDLDDPTSDLLRVGRRVCRKDSDEQGTVVGDDARGIKVKWDDGKTSYFKRGQPGNVRVK